MKIKLHPRDGFSHRPSLGCRAFTLVELLMVIAIITILATLSLGSVVRVKRTAQSTVCKNNLRQLSVAWALYASENNDVLPPNRIGVWNFSAVCPEGFANNIGSWVLGDAKTGANPWNLRNGVLFPYVSSTDVYRCPSDKSTVAYHPDLPRLRSYVMAYWMNGDKKLVGYDPSETESFPMVRERFSQLEKPSQMFVFIDEAEQVIRDGTFFMHYADDNGEASDNPHWMDVPADRHGRGCELSFADGHAEHLKWKAPKNKLINPTPVAVNSPQFQDLRKLQTFMPERPMDRGIALDGRAGAPDNRTVGAASAGSKPKKSHHHWDKTDPRCAPVSFR